MESPNFFRDNSPFLRHPLLTAERTAAEIDFLTPRLGITPTDRVLDIGCGFGRHSIELARRGFDDGLRNGVVDLGLSGHVGNLGLVDLVLHFVCHCATWLISKGIGC